jgi:cell division protein FtsL
MEKTPGCSSCKNKDVKFSSYEKKMIWVALVMMVMSIYGIVSMVKDIISLF